MLCAVFKPLFFICFPVTNTVLLLTFQLPAIVTHTPSMCFSFPFSYFHKKKLSRQKKTPNHTRKLCDLLLVKE